MARRSGHSRLPTELDEEERRLWRRVVADVRPLAAAREDRAPAAGTAAGASAGRSPRHDSARSSSQVASTFAPRRFAPPQEGLDPRTRRIFSRGRRPIERTVDLHGLNRQQAFERLLRELHSARRRGERVVLVVTGKGRSLLSRSGGPHADADVPGVLRRQLPLWLESPELSALIHRYAPASPRHGGAGAFYLFVRRLRE